jgi:feruloyl esterase
MNDAVVRSAAMGPEAATGASTRVCVVRGEIITSASSVIHFRLDLPDPSQWNTKLLMVGGAGFDGVVPTEQPAGLWFTQLLGPDAGQVSGFALVSSDSGHEGRGKSPISDFSWVARNPTALRNHAYEANHTVLVAASELLLQFYGRPASRRYIAGGSNGGRMGLVAIQHYPFDYDGVLALEPAISQEGFAANLGPEMLSHIFASSENWMDSAQIALYEKGELAACDALDGLKDGILANPMACNYDGSDLQCKSSERPSDACLTAGQLESIRRIHEDKKVPVTLADGWVGYMGFGRGGESSDWAVYLFGPSFAAREAADYVLADNIVKWGITDDPNATVMTLDPTQWAAQYRALSDEIDATNPDLSAFYAHGGKLIVWYGDSDACVSYRQTARYLDSVRTKLGDEMTRKFLRFYISPATGHSMAGAGESTEPLLSALEAWVEQGRSPQQPVSILAAKSAAPGATRPLCEYPQFPRYRGHGDPTKADSFACSGT